MTTFITGIDEHGNSTVVSSEGHIPVVASGMPSCVNTPFAKAEYIAQEPLPVDDGRVSFFPPGGGYRFFRLTIQPEGDANETAPSQEQYDEVERLFPGLLSVYDESGMETTATIDFGYVVAGTVDLVLDSGSTTLHAGDAFVQRGTRHQWRNCGSEPVTMVVAMLGTGS